MSISIYDRELLMQLLRYARRGRLPGLQFFLDSNPKQMDRIDTLISRGVIKVVGSEEKCRPSAEGVEVCDMSGSEDDAEPKAELDRMRLAISAIQLSMTLTKTSPTIMVVSTSDLQRLVKTGADQAARILTWISDDSFVARAKIDDATGFVTEIVVNESILGLSANDMHISQGERFRRSLGQLSQFGKPGVSTGQSIAPTVEPEESEDDRIPALSWEKLDAPVRPLQGLLERLRTVGALSPEFALLLGRDAGEVGLCIHAGAPKAALILCGGILEGVLTSVLMHNQAVAEREFQLLRARRKFPDDAGLPDLVRLSRKDLSSGLRPLLRDAYEGLAVLINGHRDLVHPHAEVRAEQLPITPHTVSAVLGSLCALLDGIAREIDAGWLADFQRAA